MSERMSKNVFLIVYGLIVITLLMMSSGCSIQFGDYERYKEVHRGGMCDEKTSQEDYYVNCHNCDEID